MASRRGKRPHDMEERVPDSLHKAGGHGDHWGCIYREAQREDVVTIMQTTVEGDPKPDRPVPGVEVYRSGGPDIGTGVLVSAGRVVSAYPEVRSGSVWSITIREVVPWANGLEGQVAGSCMGAEICFFDTRFYRNGTHYRVGDTYSFRMGALAYNIGPAGEMEAESGEGDTRMKVSLKGACAYMPASPGNSGADIDDYWFHSPVDDPPTEAEFEGRSLQVYRVTIGVPSDFEMSLSLYAARHTVAPEMASAAPDDDITGYLWLQGYLDEE